MRDSTKNLVLNKCLIYKIFRSNYVSHEKHGRNNYVSHEKEKLQGGGGGYRVLVKKEAEKFLGSHNRSKGVAVA